MSWNNGYERKRFEKKLKKQREIYAKQGITNSQIEEIEKLDWEIFNSDRRFFTHNQPLEFDDFEEETKNPLMFYFAHDFFDTVSPDYSDKEWWIDELEDERIYALVKKLSDEEKTILTMIAFDECSLNEVCRERGISRFALYRRIEALRRRFSEVLNREVGDENV